MATPNRVLMEQAEKSLKGRWGTAIGTCVIYILTVIAINLISGAGEVISLLVGGPFMLGLSMFTLAIARNENAYLELIFKGFEEFIRALSAYLYIFVFTILWLLLLIIPGIVAAISYSMTYFIMVDDKEIDAMAAIDKSKAMMDGYKMKYFRLILYYLGFSVLCIFTLGIGFLWLFPYIQVTNAKFYDDVKREYLIKISAASDTHLN